MKKGEKKYLIGLIVLFFAYVATDFLAPKAVDWTVTFHNKDKNPFGAYILAERANDLFEGNFEISNQTIAELSDLENLLILAEQAEISGADYRSLMSKLDSGTHVFVAANGFSPTLKDTLGFDVSFSFHMLNQTIFEAATSNILAADSVEYEYPFSVISNYFTLEDDSDWEVLATLEHNPILISKELNEGVLTLCSTPYIFTNFGLLYNDNFQAAASMLSLLPERKTHLSLFYHLGKAEPTTPFRYFLRRDALRWSLYLALFSVTLFLIITSRRQQRPIPVIEPHQNTTVKYVKTLGALFYSERNHKKAAQRIVSYFLRSLKEKYYLHIDYSERFYKHLSAKSGIQINEVIQTFEYILKVRDLPRIDEKTLMELTRKIEQFK